MILEAQRARRWSIWGVVAALSLLLVSVAVAQTGSVRIIDPAGLLGAQQNAAQQAAQQLANEGAQVIVAVDNQNNAINTQNKDQERSYISNLLQRNNVGLTNDQIQPNQIVYYVNPVQGYTGVYYGTTWRGKLDPTFRGINTTITQRASTGDLAGGLVAGINATRTAINPPTPTFVYVLGGVLALTVVGLVAAPIVRRRREAATTLGTARDQAAHARREAGAAIADLGQRMENARAKAQYDAFSYAPADAQRVQALQRDAEQTFADAQAAFDAAEEQERLTPHPSANDYQRITEQYTQGRALTQQAAAALAEAEQLRATLDAQHAANSPPS